MEHQVCFGGLGFKGSESNGLHRCDRLVCKGQGSSGSWRPCSPILEGKTGWGLGHASLLCKSEKNRVKTRF